MHGGTAGVIDGNLIKNSSLDIAGWRWNRWCPRMAERRPGVDHPDRCRPRGNQSWLSGHTGNYEKALADFIARQPMGRIGTPQEIASLALYLGSDESSFTTGQTHAIDGGWAV